MSTVLIDAHHHLTDQPDYAAKLLDHYDALGVGRVCVHEVPPVIPGFVGHAAYVEAIRRWPDRIVGFAWLDLDRAQPEDVRRFKDEGFRGLKCIIPQRAYNDPAYERLYEEAERRKMLMLFHLGIVARFATRIRIDNNLMRAVYLDTIARLFPDLTIIGAHFGNPWYEEAAMACRWNPNLYFDLTGSTLKAKPPEFIGRLLWWGKQDQYYSSGTSPWQKIVFGTDVNYPDAAGVISDYRNLMSALSVPPELQDMVWGGTMARLLAVR